MIALSEEENSPLILMKRFIRLTGTIKKKKMEKYIYFFFLSQKIVGPLDNKLPKFCTPT